MADRLDLESYGQLLLAARHGGRFIVGHGQGVSDAAFGRTYGERRSRHAYREDYRLGYSFGRFVLFAGLHLWRPVVTQDVAAQWWSRFLASDEGKPWRYYRTLDNDR